MISRLVFHKTLPVVVLPLGVSLLLLAASLRWQKRTLTVIPMMLLWSLGTPAVSDTLMRTLEDRYPPCAIAACPQSDAIVVFGGMFGEREQPGDEMEWNDSAPRFDRALALYFAGRTHILVLSAGERPEAGEPDDGDRLKRIAVQRGVPAESIIVTRDAGNTAAEAVAFSKLASQQHWKRVLAVTSAFHMPRAMFLLRGCPAEVVPVPVSYQTTASPSDSKSRKMEYFLPGAEALSRSERALREYLGLGFYRITGR